MAKNEIIIPVRLDIIGESSSGGNDVPMAAPNAGGGSSKTKTSDDKGGLGKVIAIDAVKRAGQFALSNYGNLTGDYQTQANIQGGLELAGLGAMALSGPVGFAAAVGSLTLKAVSNQIELAKRNQATEMLRFRTGMNSYSGGRS
jgi:hypothetical protein